MDPEPTLEVWRGCGTIPSNAYPGRRVNVKVVVATDGGLDVATDLARNVVDAASNELFVPSSVNKIIAIDYVDPVSRAT